MKRMWGETLNLIFYIFGSAQWDAGRDFCGFWVLKLSEEKKTEDEESLVGNFGRKVKKVLRSFGLKFDVKI